jgi:hypothetical protein
LYTCHAPRRLALVRPARQFPGNAADQGGSRALVPEDAVAVTAADSRRAEVMVADFHLRREGEAPSAPAYSPFHNSRNHRSVLQVN